MREKEKERKKASDHFLFFHFISFFISEFAMHILMSYKLIEFTLHILKSRTPLTIVKLISLYYAHIYFLLLIIILIYFIYIIFPLSLFLILRYFSKATLFQMQ